MNRSEFPILLIGMHDFVEGTTRMQKYGFLSSMQIKELRNSTFYDDWKASNYGPFSAKLASDIQTCIQNETIKKHTVRNRYDFLVDRYAITEKGKTVFEKTKYDYTNLYNKILTLTAKYQSKSLTQLLQDVYYQYPQYVGASKIRAEIGKKIYESDSYLSTQYDESDNEY